MQKHEIAAALIADFSIGSLIDGDDLLDFWQQKVLQRQVAVPDCERRGAISKVRRWLNEAGRSPYVPQPQRFFIAVVDARRATYSVVSYVDHVLAKADSALERSKRGGLAALDRSLKKYDDINLDELSNEQRQQMKIGREVVATFRACMAEVYHDIELQKAVEEQVNTDLTAMGISKADRALIETRITERVGAKLQASDEDK